MKKIISMILMLFSAGAITVQASVLFGGTANDGTDTTKTWTITDLNNLTPTATGDGTPSATGSFSAQPLLGSTESVQLVFSASTNWNTVSATDASNFLDYMATLGSADIGTEVNDWGVVGDTGDDQRLDVLGEAMFVTFNTAGLTSGSLELNDIGFDLTPGNDAVDVLLYDSSAGILSALQINTAPEAFAVGNYAIDDNDMLIMAVSTTSADAFRFDTLTLDIIPEPVTLGLVGVFGGGLLFIRRRFMI